MVGIDIGIVKQYVKRIETSQICSEHEHCTIPLSGIKIFKFKIVLMSAIDVPVASMDRS